MSIQRLMTVKDEKQTLLDSWQEIEDKAEAEKRDITEHEESEYKKTMRKVDKLSAEESEILKDAATAAEWRDLTSRSVGMDGINLLGNGEKTTATRQAGARDYRSMFYGQPDKQLDTRGFDSFDEFIKVLESGRYEPRLNELRQMVTSLGSEGGFMVPEGFSAKMLDVALESEIVRPSAQIFPMDTETMKVPGWAGFDHTGGTVYGGFDGAWLAEAGTATREIPELRQIELKAKKLAIYTHASRELVESGVNFESQLMAAMQKATSWHLDRAFIAGNGVGQPLGILNSPGVVTQAPEGGQGADTILHENLSNMFSRLHPSLINKAVWLANSSAIPQLLQLSIAVGVGGVHIPVMTESSNGQFKILTRPVIFTEKLPALGTEGDIVLVSLDQYAIGLRREIFIDKSNSVGWLQDLSDYRCIVRVDGMGSWSDVVTPENGPTQGWAVTLGDR